MISYCNKHKRWSGLIDFKLHNPAILYWSVFIKPGDWLIMYMYVNEIALLNNLYGSNLPSWWNDTVKFFPQVKWQPTHIKGQTALL
jgi:hypothetical protein